MFTFYSIEVKEGEVPDLTKPVDYMTLQDILNLLKTDEQEKEMSDFDIKVGDKFQVEVTDSIKGSGITIGPFYFDETHITDFLKHFKKIETTSKEFDLKVGDKVRLANGWIETVLETDYPRREFLITNRKNPYSSSQKGIWYKIDGTYDGGHSVTLDYFIVEKIEDEKPLEWVVGKYYKNRDGDKVKLIADWRNESKHIDENEVLQWVGDEINEQYGTNEEGIYYYDTDGFNIISYWEEPPKLHKKLERRIRFNEDSCSKEIDHFLGMNVWHSGVWDEETRKIFPHTATVKIEIIED